MDNFSFDTLINAVASNRILLIIVLLLASLLIYSILKRLVKIIVIILIALVLYLGYLNYTGKDADGVLKDYIKKGEKKYEDVTKKRDRLGRSIDQADKLMKQVQSSGSSSE